MESCPFLLPYFQQNGGYFAGHTTFRNGMHGDGWLEKGAIIRDHTVLDSVAEVQARAIQTHFPEADLVLCTGECGAIVASSVARFLKLPLALTVSEGGELNFHRMHVPDSRRRVVFVDDLVFSGTDVRSHIAFLSRIGMTLVGISVWVNRQSDRINGIPVHSLMPPPFSIYAESECPLCAAHEPIVFAEIRE